MISTATRSEVSCTAAVHAPARPLSHLHVLIHPALVNYFLQQVENILKAAGSAEEDFDVVISAYTFEPSQTESDTLCATAQALGIRQDQCAVVTDTCAGIQSAKTAGEAEDYA